MYIARSVASGLLLEPGCAPYPQMPLLSLRAQKYYFMAYAKKEYLDRNDKKDTCHGYVIPAESKDSNILGSGDVLDSDDILTSDNDADGNSAQAKNRGRDIGGLSDAAEPSFHHRPDHDVESFFWVLLATLLQAQPKYSEDDTHLADYWDAYDMFSRHSIQDGRENDSRTELLSYRERQFKHALHPKLHNLAPMLSEMAKQVAPEYGYMDPPPALDHLHEAMRRLLLEQIVQMEHAHNPIELLPGYMRPLKDPKEGDSQPASSRGNKRKSGTDWEKNSSKRVKYGYGANYRGPPDVDTYWRNLNSLPWSRPRYLPV